jgi:hypothetical protein
MLLIPGDGKHYLLSFDGIFIHAFQNFSYLAFCNFKIAEVVKHVNYTNFVS